MKRILFAAIAAALVVTATACAEGGATDNSGGGTQGSGASNSESTTAAKEGDTAETASGEEGGGYNQYFDEEMNITLNYPSVFSKEPQELNDYQIFFTSSQGEIELTYWTIPNTYGETQEEFVESSGNFSAINIHGDAVVGWNLDLNQETGETAPFAYYWHVAPEYIACVAIRCEDEAQAEEWYQMMMSDNIVYFEF